MVKGKKASEPTTPEEGSVSEAPTKACPVSSGDVDQVKELLLAQSEDMVQLENLIKEQRKRQRNLERLLTKMMTAPKSSSSRTPSATKANGSSVPRQRRAPVPAPEEPVEATD